MAAGKASDFKIYNDQFFDGLIETTQQATEALGGVGITVNTKPIRGDYDYRSFIKKIASLVTRRDTTSVSAATDLAVAMDEIISVKLNRKIGPVAQTLDSWRKAALPFGDAGAGDNGAEAFSRYLGAMAAKDVAIDMLDTALIAAWKALEQSASNKFTIATNGTMTTSALISGLSMYGDAANRIKGLVMHSKVYFDLVQAQVAANTLDVTGGVIKSGMPVTINRPVYVTDSASLKVAGTPDLYRTLMLIDDGIVIENSETQEMAFALVTGLENLVARMQGEFAYNLKIAGFKWDVANGGANPSSGAVSTATNWDAVATSTKDYAGVSIISG